MEIGKGGRESKREREREREWHFKEIPANNKVPGLTSAF